VEVTLRTKAIDRGTFLAGAAAAGTLLAAPRAVRADDTLRIAFVPEVGATPQSIAEKKPVVDYLQSRLNRKIDLLIPQNYAATVTAVGSGSVDVAHFGGLTYLIARKHYGVIPIVQRIEDQQFHSLFICNAANAGLNSVAGLKGKTFAFGDVASTSGHLIPAKDMYDAKIDPLKDITARFTGTHPATAIAVSSGQVDAGALDESVYHSMVDSKAIDPAKARVFHTSEPFVDYVWTARKDLDSATIGAVRNAFLQLIDPTVLRVLRASKYVVANDQEYAALRVTADRLKLLS
jgi:phosphonate transport system substrate-binding protein